MYINCCSSTFCLLPIFPDINFPCILSGIRDVKIARSHFQNIDAKRFFLNVIYIVKHVLAAVQNTRHTKNKRYTGNENSNK